MIFSILPQPLDHFWDLFPSLLKSKCKADCCLIAITDEAREEIGENTEKKTKETL